jgi:hypothetical protein
LRVFLLVTAAVLLTWYARQGMNNPFAVVRSIRVYGDGGGYAVAAIAESRKAGVGAVGEVAVFGGALGGLPAADSSGEALWRAVSPFAGDGAGAVLLSYGGMTALACDTAIFAPLRGGAAVLPQFYEKLDIVAVPPSSDSDILAVRNRFRPRFVAAAPCSSAPARNILCAPQGENGRFNYIFSMNARKLEVSGGHQKK